MHTGAKKPRLLAVVGATASGKTALAVELARRLDGEIVCCDSMQIYRGMDIGTAKPTAEERRGVPHHLFDILNPTEPFSVGDYVTRASAVVDDIVSRGKLPVFCGGTGLYLDAFLRGGMIGTPEADEALRRELLASAETDGGAALLAELAACDPESAAAIHKNNLRRLVRAVEIFRLSGIPKSEWDRRSREQPSLYDATVLGLAYECREVLYERIDARVDAMMAEGLLAETERIEAAGIFERSRTAAAAIGYKELRPYLAGEVTLSAAVAELKAATRRYAKRQITWFTAKDYVTWIPAIEGGTLRKFEEIVNNALEICEARAIML